MKLLILTLATWLLCLEAAGVSQSSRTNAPADQQTEAQAPEPSSQNGQPMQRLNLTTFEGKIAKDSAGRWFLVDAISNLHYQLENQKEAAKHAGETVTVLGRLVPPGRVLHVEKIERVR